MKKIMILLMIVIPSLLLCIPQVFASTVENTNYAESSCGFTMYENCTYDLSNTFHYSGQNTDDEARYNLNSRIEGVNVSESEDPHITVITHGLAGSASHWSNDGEQVFAYSEDSIITSLAKRTESNVYWVKFDTDDTSVFNIFDITSEVYDGKVKNYTNIKYNDVAPSDNDNEDDSSENHNEVMNVSDISKHSIVVFEASESVAVGTNDEVYDQFNFAISKIVYDLSVANNGILPRMNLIGHSRGGITNMQYALDHPELVHSIFSIGTPYTGSTTAKFDHDVLFSLGTSGRVAEKDIISEDVYMKYMNRWNDGYDDGTYSHIKVFALAGKSTLNQLIFALIDNFGLPDILDPAIKILTGVLSTSVCSTRVLDADILLDAVLYFLDELKDILNIFDIPDVNLIDSRGNTFAKVVDVIDHLVHNINRAPEDILRIIMEIDCIGAIPIWNNDALVDLGSQLGYEGLTQNLGNYYKGFEHYTKLFTVNNSEYENKAKTDSAGAVHNIETRDSYMISKIMQNITAGGGENSPILTKTINGNELKVIGYIGKFSEENLIIPMSINNMLITEIGEFAFTNNVSDNESIVTITLPSSIKKIESNAFSNNENVTHILFEENSELREIESFAFYTMPNLKSIEIPKDVEYISEQAFVGTQITNFDIDEDNSYYEWKNGLLIDKNVSVENSYIALYADPSVEVFTIPNDVKILSASLFENNSTIREIDLNNVEYVGDYAFYNSTLEVIHNGKNIKNTGVLAFEDTIWIKNQDSLFITLGTVILSYSGNDVNVIIPEGITRVEGYSFMSKQNMNIILPSTIETIGASAFINFSGYEMNILFTSSQPPVLDGNIVSGDANLYVRESSITLYENDLYFKNMDVELNTLSINIEFVDSNDNYIGQILGAYGSNISGLLTAPTIEDKRFVYWIDELGNKYYENSYITSYFDLILTPVYEDTKFTIDFLGDDSQGSIELIEGEVLDLGSLQKDGYILTGLYDLNNNMIVNEYGVIIGDNLNEVDYLYLDYVLIEYTITIDYNDNYLNAPDDIKFTVENPITLANFDGLENLKRFGYILDGLFIINQEYLGTEFESTEGIYSDITIQAVWLGDLIVYDSSAGDVNVRIVNEYAIIDLSAASATNYYRFTIAPNVISVTFIGRSNKTFLNMQISTQSRSNALIMGFESMNFRPAQSTTGTGTHAITSTSSHDLYILYNKTNRITGGIGKEGTSYTTARSQATDNRNGYAGYTGGDGYTGGRGVYAYSLIFSEYDASSKIYVTGGAGGAGGTGQTGQQGSDGVRSPYGSIFKPRKGDDGANGGLGGNGGNGGTGGIAVYAISDEAIKVGNNEQSQTYVFTGGRGGRGGNAGRGGAGGDGASDTSASPTSGVGDPGDGGNGANGGNGGNGGSGGDATNTFIVQGTGGLGGARGTRGSGGSRGNGGEGGTIGDDGDNGAYGTAGKNGSYGIAGNPGKSTDEQPEGIKNIDYAFDMEFIEKNILS